MNKLIKLVELKCGPAGPESKLEFAPETMTVVVGPNSSGKSQLLREVFQYCSSGPQADRKILRSIVLQFPTREWAETLLQGKRVPTPPDQHLREHHIRVATMVPTSGGVNTIDVNIPHLLDQISEQYRLQQSGQSSGSIWDGIYFYFFALFTLALDGRTRFALTEDRPAGDLSGPPSNFLVALFKDPLSRRRVRELTAEAFGLHFVIDPTNLGHMRVRWSRRAPIDEAEEQALDQRARDFHAAALRLENVSDGVKAFTGLTSALLCADYRIMLVDEPEAFLHPPLARKLGSRMSELADDRGANVFAATHSADFLMGCVESGKKVNVLRLTYENGVGTSRILSSDRLEELMKDPLLRASTPLSALFHSAAVVCEGDADQAFYREINWRLEAAKRNAIKDAIFLRVPGKPVVHRLVGPLRTMGIPAAAIVDIDILKGKDLNNLCDACAVPEVLKKGWATIRGNLEARFKELNLDMKKGGINQLPGPDKQAAEELLKGLQAYGIFVVPLGELESWLKPLGATGNKQEWLESIFEKMGSDPTTGKYLNPANDDVWEFIEQVGRWTANPGRSGIPF